MSSTSNVPPRSAVPLAPAAPPRGAAVGDVERRPAGGTDDDEAEGGSADVGVVAALPPAGVIGLDRMVPPGAPWSAVVLALGVKVPTPSPGPAVGVRDRAVAVVVEDLLRLGARSTAPAPLLLVVVPAGAPPRYSGRPASPCAAAAAAPSPGAPTWTGGGGDGSDDEAPGWAGVAEALAWLWADETDAARFARLSLEDWLPMAGGGGGCCWCWWSQARCAGRRRSPPRVEVEGEEGRVGRSERLGEGELRGRAGAGAGVLGAVLGVLADLAESERVLAARRGCGEGRGCRGRGRDETWLSPRRRSVSLSRSRSQTAQHSSQLQ